MADDQKDNSQKTEDPTQRRLEQAREKGQVAKSQEVTHWFMILAGALIVEVTALSGVFIVSLAAAVLQYLTVRRLRGLRVEGRAS